MPDLDPLAPYQNHSNSVSPLSSGAAERRLGLDDPDESAPLELKGGEPSPTTKTVELNIVADFPNPYGGLAKEVDAIKNRRWGPTTDDFTDIVVSALRCDSFAGFGAAILLASQEGEAEAEHQTDQPVHPRESDLIAFKGTVKPLSIGVDVMLEVGSGLNSNALQTWNGQGFFLEDPTTKKHYTLADIQARFTGKSAEIWLYACHSGVDSALVQNIASTFQVTVIGFTDAIAYCPMFTEMPPSINRKQIAIKDCSSPVTDFRTLSTGIVKKTP